MVEVAGSNPAVRSNFAFVAQSEERGPEKPEAVGRDHAKAPASPSSSGTRTPAFQAGNTGSNPVGDASRGAVCARAAALQAADGRFDSDWLHQFFGALAQAGRAAVSKTARWGI